MKNHGSRAVLSAFLTLALVAGLSPATALAVQENAGAEKETLPDMTALFDSEMKAEQEADEAFNETSGVDKETVAQENADEVTPSVAVEAETPDKADVEEQANSGVEEQMEPVAQEQAEATAPAATAEPAAAEEPEDKAEEASLATQDDDEDESINLRWAEINGVDFNYYALGKMPTVTVTSEDGETLVKGKDYTCTLEYSGEDDDAEPVAVTNTNKVGRYYITINAVEGSRCNGSTEDWFDVFDPKDIKNTSRDITGYDFYKGALPSDYAVVIHPRDEHYKTIEDKTLVEGTDYTLAYYYTTDSNLYYGDDRDKMKKVTKLDPKTAGYYFIWANGKGSYHGERYIGRVVVRDKMDVANCSVGLTEALYGSDTVLATPSIAVVLDFGEGATLKEGVDYTVTYYNSDEDGSDVSTSGKPVVKPPLKAGWYTAQITGKGAYKGTKRTSFEVRNVYDVENAEVDYRRYYAYTGNPVNVTDLVITDRLGNILKEGLDYTVYYEDASEDRIEKGWYYFEIQGKGKYSGVYESEFRVVPENSLLLATVEFQNGINEFSYTGKPIVPTYKVVMHLPKGDVVLQKDKDYSAVITYYDERDERVETEKPVAADDYYVRVSPAEGSGYIDSISECFTIVKPKTDLAKASVSVAKATYTGKALKPAVTVKVGTKTLVAGTDYEIAYANNVKAGKKASVVITGMGDYKGTVSKAFTIAKAKNPLKVKASSKAMKAKTLKKKAKTMTAIKVVKKAGKVTFAKVKKGSAKQLTVNKKNGKITVKKGTKKGTYTIKVKVKAKGNANYKAASKVVKVKVKVK